MKNKKILEKINQLIVFLFIAIAPTTTFAFDEQQHIKKIKHRINSAFEQLNSQLDARKELYSSIHKSAITDIKGKDLKQLRAEYSRKLGMDVDLYRVNPNLVITDTTFDNDLGLDFKEPYFKDAQYLFNLTKQSSKIIIGNPTLEISTHQYKIYSHSYLNDNTYLQLGFTDPELPLYFKQAINSIESHPNIQSAELYIQYDNLQVSPLSITNTMRTIDKETLDKMSYLKAVQEQTIKDTALFHDLENNQMIVHKNNNREETYNMYLSLSKLAFVEDIHANIICKVTFEKQ